MGELPEAGRGEVEIRREAEEEEYEREKGRVLMH